MTNLLVLILDDLDRLSDLLKAWKEIGVGVTILNSMGGFRTQTWLERIGLGGINRLLETDEGIHAQRLLVSVIESEELLERAIDEAERVLEGLDRPNSGISFVIPVSRAFGLKKWGETTGDAGEGIEVEMKQELGQLFSLIDPSTPVSDLIDVLSLEPALVRPDSSIEEVVEEMLSHPSVKTVGVINDEGYLVGIIDFLALSEAVFFSIFPETYLSELHDVDRVLDFAKRQHDIRKAADIMQEPVFLKPDDKMEKAFRVLHEHNLSGLPVVNEHYHVSGYINLLELIALCYTKGDELESIEDDEGA